jgi:hypothetical protein
MLGVAAFLAACDFSSTDNQPRTLSPAEAAARAQATVDSATKYKDSLSTARKNDSIALVTQKNTWKTDSAGFITAAKTALDKWKSDSGKARKKFLDDSGKGAKQHAKDSAAWAKDSLAGVKALGKDSAAWAKKAAADSVLFDKAVAAMAKKYTADSNAIVALVNKYATILNKDSTAITTAQAAVDADTVAKSKAVKQKALDKATAKLATDQTKFDAAMQKAILKESTDSTKGEDNKTKVLTKRGTDSTTAATKYTKDSTTYSTKVGGRVTTWNSNDDKDSTLRGADTAAFNLKSRMKDTAKVKKDSADSAKHYSDTSNIRKADSSFLVRKAVPAFDLSSAAAFATGPKDVNLTTAFPSGRIFYTLDGTNPDSSHLGGGDSTHLYSSAITLTIGKTIKAQAFLKGYAASKVYGQTYVVGTDSVTIPTSVDTTGDSVRVQFKARDVGSDFYYTVNGTTVPTTTTSSTIFKVSAAATKDTVSIMMSGSATVKVIAVKTGRVNSPVLTQAVKLTLPTPVFSHPADTIKIDSIWVKIKDTTTAGKSLTGASIRYTLTGTAPTATTGTVIASGDSVKITSTSTLKAIAFRTGTTNSATASVVDSIKCDSITGSFSSAVGGHGNDSLAVTATLTTTSPSAAIYYTLDGSAPTAASTLYNASSKPKVLEAATIKAVAVRTGSKNGTVFTKAN